MMDIALEIDQDTFQDLVKFYGETFNLPPLASKIYACLIFDFDRKGICFDEFVAILSASKSSVSANLHLLLNANLIKDFNKIDERKRFFLINEDYTVLRFEEIIEKMKREIQILDKLDAFRKMRKTGPNPRFEIYRSLLNKNIVNIQDTLLKL